MQYHAIDIESNIINVKWCIEQSHTFRQSHKRVNADQVHYVQSSSGLITIVVMTLLIFTLHNRHQFFLPLLSVSLDSNFWRTLQSFAISHLGEADHFEFICDWHNKHCWQFMVLSFLVHIFFQLTIFGCVNIALCVYFSYYLFSIIKAPRRSNFITNCRNKKPNVSDKFKFLWIWRLFSLCSHWNRLLDE